MHAGTYRVNITPPLGVSLEGNYFDRRAQDIADDLYANALVLDDGQTEMAIVSVDVCAIPYFLTRNIANRIVDLCKIPVENILITATHTHTGPALDSEMAVGLYSISQEYLALFEQQVASAVRLAQLRKKPVRVGAGKGMNRDFVFNRRLKRPDGSIIMNWIDKKYLQDCQAGGVVDPEVGVLKFESETGQPLAFLVNYANHNNAFQDPVWGSTSISADYAGVLGDLLRQMYGTQVVVLFLPGCAGNVNWVDHLDLDQFTSSLYQRIGKSLVGTVLQAEAGMEYYTAPQLQSFHRQLMIPERPYCDYDATIDWTFGPPDENMEFFNAYRMGIERWGSHPLQVHAINIHVLKIGSDIAVCTNPAELFVEFGLQIKSKSACKYTLPVELTDGAVGYVPTRKAFEEGGYEVRKIAGGSVLAIDAGEQIVGSTLDFLT